MNGLLPLGVAVALLAEGVDRNALHAKGDEFGLGSPSSRRAWIEIVGLLVYNTFA